MQWLTLLDVLTEESVFVEVSTGDVERSTVEDSDGERVRDVVIDTLIPARHAAVQSTMKVRYAERLHRQ